MNASDLRDLNFEQLRSGLAHGRKEVFEGYLRFGPATTRHLASLLGWDVLSVRPRACELAQMGLLREAGTHVSHGARKLRETVYRATTLAEFEAARAARLNSQLALI